MTYKKERVVEGQTPEVKDPAAVTAAAATSTKKKSKRRSVPQANVYIQAGYNNTLVTFAEENGNVLCWSSSGACGFKGARKSTPYAGQVAAETATQKAKAFGVEKVHVFVQGAGPGREQSLRGLNTGGVSIESITDTTAVPHNGCKAPRTRRV
ncbi:MAG: 30S ribosomal protein S11 [Patescibacteria group bacterium]